MNNVHALKFAIATQATFTARTGSPQRPDNPDGERDHSQPQQTFEYFEHLSTFR
jgi:hypothetical protein